ncbi:hypothetical protein TorRG33x02_347210 [Trema orientale]|uniref:Retrotransposon Copia-like N-terminal domain-containing protein n=1 Tax=Trema orientale TaxID=63057 RepID=A0A2P5ALV9_TREOI|nr:hypothetical protein TorRG33x02_347210 [Trema orientale]
MADSATSSNTDNQPTQNPQIRPIQNTPLVDLAPVLPSAALLNPALPSLTQPLTVKLDSDNYLIWKNQLLNVIIAHGLEDFLDGTWTKLQNQRKDRLTAIQYIQKMKSLCNTLAAIGEPNSSGQLNTPQANTAQFLQNKRFPHPNLSTDQFQYPQTNPNQFQPRNFSPNPQTNPYQGKHFASQLSYLIAIAQFWSYVACEMRMIDPRYKAKRTTTSLWLY